MKEFRKLSKSERSTFPYWWEHWKAFNYVAWRLDIWKPSYLFHDILKPWLLLLWKDYKRVQQWHRLHSNHHLEALERRNIDIDALIVDEECSRLTKESSPHSALEYLENLYIDLKTQLLYNTDRLVTLKLEVVNKAIERAKHLGLGS